MVLSLGRRRKRVARGLQAGAENIYGKSLKGRTTDAVDKEETREDSNDTMLEMLRLKVSGDSLECRQEGELTEA